MKVCLKSLSVKRALQTKMFDTVAKLSKAKFLSTHFQKLKQIEAISLVNRYHCRNCNSIGDFTSFDGRCPLEFNGSRRHYQCHS